MDRLLARLERRFGKLAIPRLPFFLGVIGAVVYAMGMMRPEIVGRMMLIPEFVRMGEWWRLITWVFIPPPASLIFIVFVILFYVNIGTTLEHEWGAFKLTIYYALGIIGSVIAAMVFGVPMSSEYLHTTVLFAFATLFPDVQFMFMFIIPMRAKWTALIPAGFMAYAVVRGSMAERVAIAVAVANYFLFFTPTLVRMARNAGTIAKQQRRRAEIFESDEEEERPTRACKICGLTDKHPGADLRVCTCQEVCGGKATVYCLPHARSHNLPS
jgi:hypothetical protein